MSDNSTPIHWIKLVEPTAMEFNVGLDHYCSGVPVPRTLTLWARLENAV